MDVANTNSRTAVAGILLVSLAATVFLFWLIYFKPTPEGFQNSFLFLPAMNALLNGLSAVSMCIGLYFIRQKKWETHRNFMLAAFGFSTLFLISYILHHHLHGDSSFNGTGAIRYVYFFILITHVLLSILALPLILTTLFMSLTNRFKLHKRIARFTFPIWLYVSITGVVVFLFLKLYAA